MQLVCILWHTFQISLTNKSLKQLSHVNDENVLRFIDFTAIVKEAWQAYDDTRKIIRIVDISAKVSTNHVIE